MGGVLVRGEVRPDKSEDDEYETEYLRCLLLRWDCEALCDELGRRMRKRTESLRFWMGWDDGGDEADCAGAATSAGAGSVGADTGVGDGAEAGAANAGDGLCACDEGVAVGLATAVTLVGAVSVSASVSALSTGIGSDENDSLIYDDEEREFDREIEER